MLNADISRVLQETVDGMFPPRNTSFVVKQD